MRLGCTPSTATLQDVFLNGGLISSIMKRNLAVVSATPRLILNAAPFAGGQGTMLQNFRRCAFAILVLPFCSQSEPLSVRKLSWSIESKGNNCSGLEEEADFDISTFQLEAIDSMAFEGDVLPQFREDACLTIYALIADALYRCWTQSVATRVIVKICSLPPIVPSVSPMYLLSVANSGPVMKNSELRNFFPQFRKSFNSVSSTQLGLGWGGVVRVLTADVGEKGFYHYEIVMRSDNRFETIQLPRAEYETEIDSGTVCEIIVTGSVQELLEFSKSICEKTSILKLKNISIDFFLQGTHIDDTGHHMKGLRICDGTRDLGDFTAEELLCVGAVEYLSSCRCGFREGSIADLRFRELVQVGKGRAGSSESKWSLDACVVLVDVNMANEIFPTVDSQTSVVAYFEDGCYTPAPVSVLKGLSNVKWGKFGLKIKDMQIADSGEVVVQFHEPRRISSMFMILHVHQNLKTLNRSPSPAGERKVKAAAEACMTDLKARFSELFLSEHAIQLQKIATDVSECIAGIICSSTNEEFQEECAAILQLPLQSLDKIETTIRTKMFNIIQQQDGQKKRPPRGKVTEVFANEVVDREDEEELLNYVNEDEDPLYYDDEDEELL